MGVHSSKIIRARKVAELLDVSRVTVWRWERDGRLPKKRRIGPNVVGWDFEEIEAWLAAKNPDGDQTIGNQKPEELERPSLRVVGKRGGS